MNAPPTITRRGLTLAFASLALLRAGSSGAYFRLLGADVPKAQASRVLASLSPDWRRIRPLGRAYLKMHGSMPVSVDGLMAMIFPGTVPNAPVVIRQMINERVRQDFADGAVVTVDSWILAITETRLYALAALV